MRLMVREERTGEPDVRRRVDFYRLKHNDDAVRPALLAIVIITTNDAPAMVLAELIISSAANTAGRCFHLRDGFDDGNPAT